MESTGKVTCMATRVVLGACIMVMRKPGMESHRIRDRLGSHEMRQAKRNLVELGLIRVDASHKVRMSPSPVWMGLRVEKGEGSPYGPGLRLSGDLEVVGLVLDGIIASVLVGLIYRVVSSGIMVRYPSRHVDTSTTRHFFSVSVVPRISHHTGLVIVSWRRMEMFVCTRTSGSWDISFTCNPCRLYSSLEEEVADIPRDYYTVHALQA
ncbi:hypothetical protein L1987_53759 [Smallanthus sonchifolius]|uniref:Uncharacterized protein n=1 Tax=Smallanthus sonchifolius TaxID=185202 RepID=A0ACB9EWW8_9ASTR|nr:hypothetical protein L1987_53759 [Smallanthus sonchifolius]